LVKSKLPVLTLVAFYKCIFNSAIAYEAYAISPVILAPKELPLVEFNSPDNCIYRLCT
jgi:hypothetical protein